MIDTPMGPGFFIFFQDEETSKSSGKDKYRFDQEISDRITRERQELAEKLRLEKEIVVPVEVKESQVDDYKADLKLIAFLEKIEEDQREIALQMYEELQMQEDEILAVLMLV